MIRLVFMMCWFYFFTKVCRMECAVEIKVTSCISAVTKWNYVFAAKAESCRWLSLCCAGRVGERELKVQVLPQVVDILLEGFSADVGYRAHGARFSADKALVDRDVACCRQLVELDAQVACRGFGFLFEIDKIRFVNVHQY